MCDDKEPQQMPREVTYYYMCQKFKSLPESGGLLDQDPMLLEAFLLCANTEAKHQRFKEEIEKKKREREEKNTKR
jgi:hypothetical protein